MLDDEIERWMKEKVKERDAEGVVVGLSGGVDSAVVAGLSKRAFKDNVLGVLLPCNGNTGKDLKYGELTANTFGIDTVTVNLEKVHNIFTNVLNSVDIQEANVNYWPQTKIPVEDKENYADHNMKPRLRMIALYHIAERMNYVVMGTSNLSEVITGYYTNYGDNATDLRPLGNISKTKVWELAKKIGVPEEIINRPPTAGLQGEEGDEDAIGLDYKKLDKIYWALKNNKDLDKFDEKEVDRVKELISAAKDKEAQPVFNI